MEVKLFCRSYHSFCACGSKPKKIKNKQLLRAICLNSYQRGVLNSFVFISAKVKKKPAIAGFFVLGISTD